MKDMEPCQVPVSFLPTPGHILQLCDYVYYADTQNVMLVKHLWEGSKVYSSISSHCINSLPALHS